MEPPRHLADAVARVDLSRMLRNLGHCLRDAGALFFAERRGRLAGWADGYAARADQDGR